MKTLKNGGSGIRPHMAMISAVHSDLPDLPDLENEYEQKFRSSVAMSSRSSFASSQEKLMRQSAMSSVSSFEPQEKSYPFQNNDQISRDKKEITQDDSPETTGSGHNHWMSKLLDNAYNMNKNLPSLFTKPLFANAEDENKPDIRTFGLEPPAHRLFADSSDEEDEDEHEVEQEKHTNNQFDDDDDDSDDDFNFHKSMLSSFSQHSTPQIKVTPAISSPIYQIQTPKPSNFFNDSEDEDDDSSDFELGQRVSFRTSTSSKATSAFSPVRKTKSSLLSSFLSDSEAEEEMRRSFQHKPLPEIKDKTRKSPSRSVHSSFFDDDEDEDVNGFLMSPPSLYHRSESSGQHYSLFDESDQMSSPPIRRLPKPQQQKQTSRNNKQQQKREHQQSSLQRKSVEDSTAYRSLFDDDDDVPRTRWEKLRSMSSKFRSSSNEPAFALKAEDQLPKTAPSPFDMFNEDNRDDFVTKTNHKVMSYSEIRKQRLNRNR
ncbi:unnamed protein product [Ambrosiozyma monospora]|uniref:Unnamed protein product n=1 Tax=Ambrosiozyma monospora TaxID=43982 RepID=A0ACB5T5N1_AMBMO|nr:unnamed protein product [Ambrosiozyma monospora]